MINIENIVWAWKIVEIKKKLNVKSWDKFVCEFLDNFINFIRWFRFDSRVEIIFLIFSAFGKRLY